MGYTIRLLPTWISDYTHYICGMKSLIHSLTSTVHHKVRIKTKSIFNSWRPSDAYMRHQIKQTLAQMMACRLFDTKPYLNQCCIIVSWTHRHIRQSNNIENSNIFIQENAFENVVFCLGLNVLTFSNILHKIYDMINKGRIWVN